MTAVYLSIISTQAPGKLQLLTKAGGTPFWTTKPDVLASSATATAASINAAAFGAMFSKVSAFPVGTNGMVAILFVASTPMTPGDVVARLNEADVPGVLLACETALGQYAPPPSPLQEATQLASAICAALSHI